MPNYMKVKYKDIDKLEVKGWKNKNDLKKERKLVQLY